MIALETVGAGGVISTGTLLTSSVIVTNCGGLSTIAVAVSDLTGGGVTWNPTQGQTNCITKNAFDFTIAASALGNLPNATGPMSTPRNFPTKLAVAGSANVILTFHAPCFGSNQPAQGTTMTFTTTITATL